MFDEFIAFFLKGIIVLSLLAIPALIIGFACDENEKANNPKCKQDQLVSQTPDGKVKIYCHDCCNSEPLYYTSDGRLYKDAHKNSDNGYATGMMTGVVLGTSMRR